MNIRVIYNKYEPQFPVYIFCFVNIFYFSCRIFIHFRSFSYFSLHCKNKNDYNAAVL